MLRVDGLYSTARGTLAGWQENPGSPLTTQLCTNHLISTPQTLIWNTEGVTWVNDIHHCKAVAPSDLIPCLYGVVPSLTA